MTREQSERDDEAPRGGLDDAALVEALASTVPEVPSADTRSRHLAAISSLASEHAHAAPARSEPEAAPWPARLQRVAGLTALKVGLSGAAVALAAGGGLAATGNLPDPAQRVVADAAEKVGIRIPSPPPRSAQPATGDDNSPRGERTPSEERDRPPESDRPDHDVASAAPGGEEIPGEDSREPQEIPGETMRPDDPASRGDDPDRPQRSDEAGNEGEDGRGEERRQGAGNSAERPGRGSPADDRDDRSSDRPGSDERQQGSASRDDNPGKDEAGRASERKPEEPSQAGGDEPAADVRSTPEVVTRQSRSGAVEDVRPSRAADLAGGDAGAESRDEQ